MKKTRIISIISIGFCVFLVCAFLAKENLLNDWQEKMYDVFWQVKPVQRNSDVVIFAIDNESIAKVGQWPWQRTVFAQAIMRLQNAKVIGIDVNFSEPTEQDEQFAQVIMRSKPHVILPTQYNATTKELVEPAKTLKNATWQGSVNLPMSRDGIVRKAILPQSFAKALLDRENVPANMRINYAGPANTFLTLPIRDLLEGNIPAHITENKVVFIGATAPDLHDYFQTPVGLISGVEINANIFSTLQKENFFWKIPLWATLLLLILSVVISTALVVFVRNFLLLLPALTIVIIASNIAAMIAFAYAVVVPILYIDLAIIASASCTLIFQYTAESKDRRFIYQSFKQYLSQELIDQLMANPSKLKLGGERRKVAIVFSDIRGFTQIGEAMKAEDLVSFMNRYFGVMSDIILNSRGTIEKYIGDAIVAFWGAPLENPQHTHDACKAALAMIEATKNLQIEDNKITIGIGINAGEVIVGNMGSERRLNYSIVGDNVNFTSRLEGLNKMYGTSIIISEGAWRDIKDSSEFFTRELDAVIVKGKKEPRKIFELLIEPIPQENIEKFIQAKEYYKAGEWQKAISLFEQLAEFDGPSKTFLKRCQEFAKNPPQNWQGVYEFTTK